MLLARVPAALARVVEAVPSESVQKVAARHECTPEQVPEHGQAQRSMTWVP